MKVLHVLEASGGGTARHVADLCHGLAGRGVEVHLAYSPLRLDRILKESLPGLRNVGVRLFEIPMKRPPHPSDLLVLASLWRYTKVHGTFDLLHGHGSKGGGISRLLGRMTRIPVVYTPNAFVTLSPTEGKFQKILYEQTEKYLGRLTAALVAVSLDEAREARRLGIVAERIRVIPNGIHLVSEENLAREEVRTKLGVDPKDEVIGFVARFVPQKAPQVLLEAFARIARRYPKARLVMVGEGPLGPKLSAMAKEMGLADRVHFPGPLKGRLAMRGFDVFALSSNYEGFPYALLEAMAEGLPVVATRVGGTEMAVANGESGFVVPIGDVEAFAEALGRLLSDPELRRRMGQESLKRVQSFSADKMVDATLALYQELLGGQFAKA